MPVLKFVDTKGINTRWRFFCPGCKTGHIFNSDGKEPVWTWNGSVDKPTISPSLMVNRSRPESICHSFVEDGRIRFLNDCHHELAGQTVDLPDLDNPSISEYE